MDSYILWMTIKAAIVHIEKTIYIYVYLVQNQFESHNLSSPAFSSSSCLVRVAPQYISSTFPPCVPALGVMEMLASSSSGIVGRHLSEECGGDMWSP